LTSFFNFIKDSAGIKFPNPYYSPILKKSFKDKKTVPWKILDKDVVGEIIFRTENPRNRLMLELIFKLTNWPVFLYFAIHQRFS